MCADYSENKMVKNWQEEIKWNENGSSGYHVQALMNGIGVNYKW